jgi:immune inhibitor A
LDIPSSTEPAAPLNGPVVGDINVLVLIIEFTDMKHDASHGPSHFGNMLFNSTPSVKSVNRYYDENSFGLLSVSGEVTAVWLQSAQTMAYYGADGAGGIDNKNGPIYALVTEAVRAADPLIDFSRFDRDLDGFIDHLCVVHAGQGQEASADRNTIWSHRWYDFDEPQADGVTAGYYTMLSEFSPVGTFAHELGHDMGLPDLYDYGYDSFGAGSWDLMATGSWNDNGNTPAHLSAWCKYRLGWLTPETLVESAPNLTLARIEDNPAAYRLDINPPNEYFLIENRERVGWDAALPGAGLLIWHIDEGRPDNDDQNHRMVDLEEADEAVNGDSPVQATDPWADSPQGFNPSSQPSSSAYSGDQTGYWLYEIGPSGLSMNFSVRTSFTDVAVTALDFNAYSPQNVPLVIGATVTMLSGRAAVPVDVTCTIMRGAVLFAKTEKLSALAGGAPARLQWDWTPSTAGNYIVAVSAAADEDDVRENNVRSGIARIITQLFFDDVENGTGGWEPGVNVPLVPGLWHIVDRSDRYGDARSPTHSWWCGFDATGQYRRGSEFIEYYLESPLIDLTRIQSGVLAFQQKYDISTGLPLGMTKDQGYIEASANLGAGWARLDSITGNGGNWSARYYDITNFTQSLFKFRFVLRSNVLMMGRGWYVDDLSVYAAGNIYDVALGVSPNQSWARPLKPTFFDLTVSNAGNREDSYQLTWTAPESIRVALNATTVRLGLFAGADVRAQVGIAGRAPAGSVLQIAFTATSVGNPKVSSTAVATLVVRQEWLVSLEAESDLLHAGPADNATFRVNLTNPGNGQDSVSLSASGPNGGLVVLAQDRVQLSAWEVHPLEVVLAVPADASAQSELRFCLTARSAGGPEAVLPLRLSVDRTRGVALSAAASVLEARPGGRAIFELIIANRGNGREDFTVTAEMPAGWQASHDVVIALGPFAQMRFSVDVTVPADARGGRTTVVMKASSAGGSPGTVSLGIEVVLPDLYLSGLRIEPQFSDEGRTVTVYVTAGNSGTANATAVIVAVYDNGKRLKDWTADRLAPGQWETLTFKLKLAKGNHMLSAVASTPDRELSSTNNQLSGDAKVRASSSFIPAGGAVLALAALLGAASARFIGRRR